MKSHATTACDIALFGALGDLAQRKLLPALYQLERSALLHADTRLMALARDKTDLAGFEARIRERFKARIAEADWDEEAMSRFFSRFTYTCLDFKACEATSH